MSAPNSRFGTYLDNYNKENKFIISAVQRFSEQISTDMAGLVNAKSDVLSPKFGHLQQVLVDDSRSSYDKALFAGSLLADIAPDIFTSNDPALKKGGANVINSFLNLAKTTEDEQLLNNAMRIGESLSRI